MKYRKTVEAVKLDDDFAICEKPSWLVEAYENGLFGYDSKWNYYYTIKKGNWQTVKKIANKGDYIVYDNGLLKIVTEEEFEKEYKAVKEEE